jgi:CheY-like chemotaxis protein
MYRVLIADDVVFSQDVLKHFLNNFGVQADCVSSGIEAVDAIRKEKVTYNAVFIDQMMPVMDGMKTAYNIRQIGSKYAGTIPLIAITANQDIGDKRSFLCKGFQDYVSKPIDPAQLEIAVRRWVVADFANHSLNAEESLNEFRCSFVKNIPAIIEKARTVSEDKSALRDYAVRIHGIKGSCSNIGEGKLAERAGELEKAAKLSDYAFIVKHNAAFLEDVSRLIANM